MCLTVLEQGVWFRVKKKRACPCTYWGRFCTDIHGADEVFAVFTNDDVKFVSTLKNTGGPAM